MTTATLEVCSETVSNGVCNNESYEQEQAHSKDTETEFGSQAHEVKKQKASGKSGPYRPPYRRGKKDATWKCGSLSMPKDMVSEEMLWDAPPLPGKQTGQVGVTKKPDGYQGGKNQHVEPSDISNETSEKRDVAPVVYEQKDYIGGATAERALRKTNKSATSVLATETSLHSVEQFRAQLQNQLHDSYTQPQYISSQRKQPHLNVREQFGRKLRPDASQPAPVVAKPVSSGYNPRYTNPPTQMNAYNPSPTAIGPMNPPAQRATVLNTAISMSYGAGVQYTPAAMPTWSPPSQPEKRVSTNGHKYTKLEFDLFFGIYADWHWEAARLGKSADQTLTQTVEPTQNVYSRLDTPSSEAYHPAYYRSCGCYCGACTLVDATGKPMIASNCPAAQHAPRKHTLHLSNEATHGDPRDDPSYRPESALGMMSTTGGAQAPTQFNVQQQYTSHHEMQYKQTCAGSYLVNQLSAQFRNQLHDSYTQPQYTAQQLHCSNAMTYY